jgi:hypothetical protein
MHKLNLKKVFYLCFTEFLWNIGKESYNLVLKQIFCKNNCYFSEIFKLPLFFSILF